MIQKILCSLVAQFVRTIGIVVGFMLMSSCGNVIPEVVPRQGNGLNGSIRQHPQGQGSVIFVHGTPGRWQNWKRYLQGDSLSAFAQVAAFDRLGFGGSQPGVPVTSLEKQADALAQEARVLPKPRLWVGHSYGGPVIARLAMDHPELVDGLVLISSPADPAQARPRWYQHLAVSAVGKAMLPKNFETSAHEMLTLHDELKLLESAWLTLKVPVTVIHADNDILVPAALVPWLRERLPASARFVILEKGNHFLIWNRVSLVRDEIRRMF